MRDAHHITRAAGDLVAALQPLTRLDNVERILERLHQAKRGFPSGAEPPTEERELDEDGNPTANAITHTDRTVALATEARADTAATDLRRLVATINDMHELAARIDRTVDRYGATAGIDGCIECRKAGTFTPVDRGRYADRCRFHGDAWLANDRRDTPVAITQAHIRHGRSGVTDRLIRANPIVIVDPDGRDTGRRVQWQPRRSKRRGA